MARVSTKDLASGMRLAANLEGKNGGLLIAAGTELTDRHIRSIKLWGIASVDIDSGENAETSTQTTALSPDLLQKAQTFANEAFRRNERQADHPLVRQLTSIYTARMAREIARAKDAAAITALTARPQLLLTPKTATPTPPQSRPSLENLVQRTTTIASLPAIYNEIVRVVNDPRSSANDVANVISGDPGLTARLLRLVNSAFYGFPGRVETVSRAITLAGMNELSQLALATSVMRSFSASFGGQIDMPAFWKHSLCCGVVGRLLAEQRREPNSERYFVTGLLHDIGRLVLLAQVSALESEAIRVAAQTGRSLWMAEQEIVGFHHAELGFALLENWRLPVSQRQAIWRHHTISEDSEHANEMAVTHIADAITHALRIGRSGEPLIPLINTRAWGRLGLSVDLLPNLVDEAEMQVRDLASVFELDEGHRA